MNTLKLSALALVLAAFGSTPAFAQTEQDATASATIVTTLALDVTNPSVGFGTISSANFDAGFKAATAASVISHRGNVRHSVTITSDAATFTGAGGAIEGDIVRAAKPAADLLWSKDAFATSGTGLSTSAADVVTQAANGVYDSAVTVSYRVALAYADDTPGNYELGFTYTITAD